MNELTHNLAKEPTIPVCAGWIGSWQISLRRRPLGLPELTERYDKIAPRWQRLTERLGLPHNYQRLFERFIHHADLARADESLRVLDCGVGTGEFALAFARAWKAQLKLDAIDLSDAMLDHARVNMARAGIDAHFAQADVCALPYASGRFDVVMAAHVLEHLPNPVVALNEMRRVLKPGGWIVACLTRESFLGRCIQLKWRTHRVTNELADSWLDAAGLEPASMNCALRGSSRLTSLSCAGRKPTLQGE